MRHAVTRHPRAPRGFPPSTHALSSRASPKRATLWLHRSSSVSPANNLGYGRVWSATILRARFGRWVRSRAEERPLPEDGSRRWRFGHDGHAVTAARGNLSLG